ncbi:MAG: 1-acyl-sn-glycerol-3-phosphate acyltransferase [Candidatus Omnitrophota bacterium]|nr:MAG: 1-acyl-sn-glycerol-3-phosphate acyltransferase [Candidatus Omnitrophota bacterium]
MLYNLFRFIFFVIFKLLFRYEVRGRENIPKSGGFILASNHVSYLDPIAVGIGTSRRLSYLGRHDLFSNPFFSLALYKAGVVPIKRKSADLAALKEAMRRVKRGLGLVIFPEGTRGAGLKEVQPGIGFLAAKLNVPVVPVFVRGTEKALPKASKFIKPVKISVFFGRQISIERRTPYPDIAQKIMDSIRRLSCESNN